MAEIEHEAVRLGPNALIVTWPDVTDADTCEPFDAAEQQGLAGSIETEDTYGGTVTLDVSNGGTTYHPASFNGAAVEMSDAAGERYKEFSMSARYLRPSAPDSGTVTYVMMLRG